MLRALAWRVVRVCDGDTALDGWSAEARGACRAASGDSLVVQAPDSSAASTLGTG